MSVVARAGKHIISIRVGLGWAGTFALGVLLSGVGLYLPQTVISDPALDSFIRAVLLFTGALAVAATWVDTFLRFVDERTRADYHGEGFAAGWLLAVTALAVLCLMAGAYSTIARFGPEPELVWFVGFAAGAFGRSVLAWSGLSAY